MASVKVYTLPSRIPFKNPQPVDLIKGKGLTEGLHNLESYLIGFRVIGMIN